jgi:hypothetical protein
MPGSPLSIPSEIVVLVQGAEVVDLSGVVEVMLDHHRDDPARLLQFTPVRHPRAKKLGVIQDSDTFSEPRMSLSQPPKSLRNGRERVTALDEGIVPGELCIAEGRDCGT